MGPEVTADDDDEPQHFRSLSEIYQNTNEIELAYSDVEALLVEADEPTSFSDAAGDSEWVKAMNSEIQSIEGNRTWSLAKLPAGHKAIGLK